MAEATEGDVKPVVHAPGVGADSAPPGHAGKTSPLHPEPGKPRWFLYLEMLKVALEVCAIPAAGYWAYTRFSEDEKPSLEKRADVNGQLEWSKRSATTCEVLYALEFQNIGKLPIEVARVRLRAWYLKDIRDTKVDKPVQYLDPMAMRDGDPLLTLDTPRLAGHYGPGEKGKEGLSFIVNRLPEKRVLFMAELWAAEQAKEEQPTWTDWRHDWICIDESAPGSPPAASAPTATPKS